MGGGFAPAFVAFAGEAVLGGFVPPFVRFAGDAVVVDLVQPFVSFVTGDRLIGWLYWMDVLAGCIGGGLHHDCMIVSAVRGDRLKFEFSCVPFDQSCTTETVHQITRKF